MLSRGVASLHASCAQCEQHSSATSPPHSSVPVPSSPTQQQQQQHHHHQQRWRSRLACRALQDDRRPAAPWSLTWDLRERETEWSEANKARLVALVAARMLGIPMPDMEARLDDLVRLLPDLAGVMPRLHPSLLAGLAVDLQATTRRLLALRELLPAANVSAVVAARPQLLLQEEGELREAVGALQRLLRMPRVDKLVEAQPLFLVTACVEEVLADIQRLMPRSDAAALLASDPDWLLRAQRGQRWLGLHPDSQLGEQIDWAPPGGSTGAAGSSSNEAGSSEGVSSA